MRRALWLLTLLLVFVLGNLTGLLLWLPESAGQTNGGGATAPAGQAAAPDAHDVDRGAAVGSPAAEEAELTEQERRDIAVFRDASASVVFISSSTLRRDLFTLNVFEIPRGTGSGFVWDDRGHVVTNFHVIDQGNRWSVVLADQSDWEAELVGAAPDKDLAVLHIDAPADRLQPIRLGTSADLQVGQRVLAIGNPFGLDHSLTIGVVSATGRELDSPSGRRIRDVIQTDAAINPGNSGGPLLDSRGRLIGINAMIYSPSGASAGVGFAVPVDTVRRLVPQLIEHGRPLRAGIGVALLPDSYARSWGFDGVIVQSVTPGGPAAEAGIEGLEVTPFGRVRVGDRIVAVDGQAVHNVDDLLHAFETLGEGAHARLTVVRDRRERTVEVELVRIDTAAAEG